MACSAACTSPAGAGGRGEIPPEQLDARLPRGGAAAVASRALGPAKPPGSGEERGDETLLASRADTVLSVLTPADIFKESA